jgi:hypothetical protein
MIQPVQGRAIQGLSPLVSGKGSQSPEPVAPVHQNVGNTQSKAAETKVKSGETFKMPHAVLPFEGWPPGSEKVDNRTGGLEFTQKLSVADQLSARVGSKPVGASSENAAAPGGGEEVKSPLEGKSSTTQQSGEKGEARRAEESKPLADRELSPEDLETVKRLESRDREVRQHEASHKAMGGAFTGAIRYEYTMGPDGKRYVSDGEVPVDLSSIRGNPERTLRKMKTVRRAAMSPSRPSVADIQVAMKADQIMQRAQQEIAVKRYQEAQRMQESNKPSELVSAAVEKIVSTSEGGESLSPTSEPIEISGVAQPAQEIRLDPPDVFIQNYALSNFATLSSSTTGRAVLHSSNDHRVPVSLHSPANNDLAAAIAVGS